VRAVVELASFSAFSLTHQAFLDQLTESIGLVLNTIEANTLTENLLKQSQSQGEELRAQQEELRETNEDLGRQAALLAEQNIEAENKNQEVEQSKRLVEEKAGQLAVSSKYKSEFIANMSHELRTPLNSLLILAEQLQDNPDDTMTDTQVEYASVILASGRDLLSLLNSVLDLAKAESGTVVVEMAEVSVAELRFGLLREFEPVAHGKGVGYLLDVAPDVPVSIVTDSQRLRQIIKNLLANAFKFTEQGQVHLHIRLAAGGWSPEMDSLAAAPSVVAISVTDSGIGIVEDEQQRIFEPFAQGDGTTARNYGGTGLGLSISRELVALLGGEITVVSIPGQGSTFTIYLPLDRQLTASRTATPLPNQRGALVAVDERPVKASVVPIVALRLENKPFAGMKVLVVDDDFRNIFALTALLERGDADVTAAGSGAEAIAVLKRRRDFDLVLMDIMMPAMDGYEAIRAIRAMAEFATLPILAVTGKVVGGERERCLAAGANDYVPKPVDTVELLAAIGPWLRRSAS
jgi:signal transduction histidine kinase